MADHFEIRRFWIGIPPWIFIGALVILFPIFSILTLQDINRQKENSIRLLLEKGTALIRSFEAGTRTGMMGTQWDNLQLQKLLTETARLPDIEYLLVTDTGGTIIAHNNLGQRGRTHGKGLDLGMIARSPGVYWHKVQTDNSGEVFEVFRKFTPVDGPVDRLKGRLMRHRGLRPFMGGIVPDTQIIFVGLDMEAVEEARKSNTRHTIIMGIVLLMVGCSGVIFLFFAHRYRETKTSLSRIKVFSDNLVAYMPIGLLAVDSDKRIASFNHVAEEVLRCKAEDVIGKDARTVLPEALWTQVNSLESSSGIVEKEIECPVEGGRWIPLEVSTTVLRDRENTFLGYILLFKDLTEVQNLRKEIARSQRLASVGSLAAGVAHEVRNPLSSIKGFATYFKERTGNVPEDQKIAEIMIQEVDRLNRVVGQLLELARPVSVSRIPIPIGPLIESTLKLTAVHAETKEIQIRTDLEQETQMVPVDPDRINQVLLNLYLNAIEAMETGGCLTVTLRPSTTKNGLEIKVQDNGTGIKQEDLAHIFDPYFTTKPSGTGLGLAIVHNTIEAHDGEIVVESMPGKGTDITIFLPHMPL
jgi:two-component system sensor histidine kinase HydH